MRRIEDYKEEKPNLIKRIFWMLVEKLIYRILVGGIFNRLRVGILKAFGAQLGKVNIYSSVTIYAPWNLIVGDFTTIGPGVEIYNKTFVKIGERCTISQNAMIYTASHDYNSERFELILRPVVIGSSSWVCAGAFLSPGVEIGDFSVVSAYSVVFGRIPSGVIVRGNPAVIIKDLRKKA